MLINRTHKTWYRDYGFLYIKKRQQEKRERPSPPPADGVVDNGVTVINNGEPVVNG